MSKSPDVEPVIEQMPGSFRPETIWQDRPDENVAATAQELALIAAQLLTLSPSMLHSIVPLLQGTAREKKIEVALKLQCQSTMRIM